VTERQTSTCNHHRPCCPHHDSRSVAARQSGHATCTCPRPGTDPLAALERARRLAFEAQEAERWDGLA
jgi:hypothetical protein